LAHLLYCKSGGIGKCLTHESLRRGDQYLRMSGNEVFKHAVRTMLRAALKALKMANLKIEDIDWLFPHQANIRIMEAVAERLGIPREQVFVNIDKYGNTSAASIPLALDEARREGKLKQGQTVLAVAFGGGFTWGSAVIRF
jgi:3-oxoacyl-[acyl-carrier-protein] synthase-3